MSNSGIKVSLAMLGGSNNNTGSAKTLTYKRDLSKSEIESLEHANKILNELTARSPYKHFQDRYDDLFTKIREITTKSATGELKPFDLDIVYGKLDDLLSSLKGFEDRTKSLISDRYGKDSPQMTTFQTALSYEFDNTFDYRFCYNLRNYSQHKGSHFGRINSTAELVNGKHKSTFEIMLNSSDLLSSYSKWHSMVKQDLNVLHTEFALIPIIQQLKLSCFRIYSKYLLSQEDEVLKAIKSIEDIVGVYDPRIETPTVLEIHNGFDKQGGQITLGAIRVNLIETIRPLLVSAHHFANTE